MEIAESHNRIGSHINFGYRPAKDEAFIFSRSAPPHRKGVPFEPDKTPVPADLYFSGGR